MFPPLPCISVLRSMLIPPSFIRRLTPSVSIPIRPMQLLHLEDSPTDAELIALLIRREWPEGKIFQVATAAEYKAALERGGFDVVLSDYTLPGFDGLAALALARKHLPES